MKPSTIQLLKDKPEECKEIAIDYGMYYCTHESFKDEKVWNSFLSEALKPDWEILSFKSANGNIYTLQPDGEYKFLSSFDKDNMLNCVDRGAGVIHSVRRSDGEVLFLNDNTNHGIIKRFFIGKFGEMVVECMGTAGLGAYPLTGTHKLKPLFKTEDGVDFYKGDNATTVKRSTMKIWSDDCPHSGVNTEDLLYFSTRSAAEQWVRDHKPSVSIAQLKQAGLSEDIINSLRLF